MDQTSEALVARGSDPRATLKSDVIETKADDVDESSERSDGAKTAVGDFDLDMAD